MSNNPKLHFLYPPQDPQYWLLGHIAGMMGSYIAVATAFLVVNIQFEPAWVPWLLPTVIGTPIISYWSRKVKAKRKAIRD